MPNLFNLHGKTAIVTGGCGLLGKVFCEALAEFGANIAVVDLAQEPAQALADELLHEYGVFTHGFSCDVADSIKVHKLIPAIFKKLGPVQILLNNAATKTYSLPDFFKPFEDYTLKTWREVMSVNLDGMFLMAQAVGRQMVKQQTGGSIIQTSSIYGLMAPDFRIYQDSNLHSPAVYSASKAGVIGLTRYLAAYYAPHKIRVNTLSPGGVNDGQNEQFRKNYAYRVPLGRLAEKEELIGPLIYLASDASSYVTGQNIIVDGGLSVW